MEKVAIFFKSVGNFLLDILLRILYVFRDLGLGVWHGIVGLKNLFVKFVKRFIDGSIWTKISHIIMGFGNFARGQIVKGFIFLLLEVAFLVLMISSPVVSNNTRIGGEAIGNFFTLGDYHGMPYSQSFNFEEEFSVLDSRFSSKDLTIYEEKIYRVLNLVNALDKKEENIDLLDVDSAENIDAANYYAGLYFENVIYDNRYKTNDYYGYQKYNLEKKAKDIEVNPQSIIILNSKTEIHEQVKACIEFEDPESIRGIYYQEYNGGYRYLIIVRTQELGDVMEISKINADVEAINIHYDNKYVELGRDFSFLMLLYGIITFAIIALFIVAYNLSIASSYKADKDIKEGKKPTTFIEDLKTLLDSRFHMTLLTPAIILLVVFTVVPTIMMILIAFTDMDNGGASSGQLLINWTGFANFVELFSGSTSSIAREVGRNFASVLTWTFEWAILATFSCYFGGIFLALLINKKDVKFKKLWRTIFILTIAIPQFITLLVLRNLFDVSGPVNTMLKDLGFITESINFLQFGSNTDTAVVTSGVWLARITVLLINLYIGIPYTMLMTSGILMNIPKDLYEAATIDGANKWQMFRKITLPYVIFVTTPYLISSFIGNITSFNTIFLTTGGGPGKGEDNIAGHTDLLVTWLYKLTIEDSKFNAGSIIGILTFLITAFITLVCYRNSKAYKEEDTFQ